jgi:hypothetical protein
VWHGSPYQREGATYAQPNAACILMLNMGERPIEPRASLAGLCQNLAAMEFSNPREQKLGGALRCPWESAPPRWPQYDTRLTKGRPTL